MGLAAAPGNKRKKLPVAKTMVASSRWFQWLTGGWMVEGAAAGAEMEKPADAVTVTTGAPRSTTTSNNFFISVTCFMSSSCGEGLGEALQQHPEIIKI
jgi:hypothetical protein